MKTTILDIHGKKTKEITLPKVFDSKIREDIVQRVLESKKIKQAYSPSPVAGKQFSARGLVSHRRHVWKSQYGRGISRVPRKITSRKGSQFGWIAAGVPNVRGGNRAHPPKIISIVSYPKINKKEMQIALESAISATANEKLIQKKYSSINEAKLSHLPIVVESKLTQLKIKDLINSIKNLLGNEIFEVSIQKKSIRSGRGKMRGRRYKKNAGLLMVIGKKEKLKSNVFDVVSVDGLNVSNLAKGGLGRITIYTEEAIKDLQNKFGIDKDEKEK